jgi:hypothetical protein
MFLLYNMTKIIGTGTIDGKAYTADKPYRVDLEPVEEFISKLEEALGSEKNRKERKSVELTTYFLKAARQMDKEQMKYLVNKLVGRVEKWAYLYQLILDEPEKHLKYVQQFRSLEQLMKKNKDKSSQ